MKPTQDSTRPPANMSANVKTRILPHSEHLDIYMVRYSEGHKVGPHIDMIPAGKLYKLNMVLVKPACRIKRPESRVDETLPTPLPPTPTSGLQPLKRLVIEPL
jgi:hypothetical protein